MNQTCDNNGILFPEAADGEVFQLGGMEFIKFPATEQGTPVVAKNIAFRSRFGENNDLRESAVLKRMQEEILPKIVAAVGEENVLTFQTDLTAWDGLKPYEALESKISLSTMDFYREHVEIFDRHKADDWWWLATPDTAQPHGSPEWILCVAPSGDLSLDVYYSDDDGVRPFCILNSAIFGSSEA